MAGKSMDYKATLNLPKTDFPMKANLPQREPELLAFWNQERLMSKSRKRERGGNAICFTTVHLTPTVVSTSAMR